MPLQNPLTPFFVYTLSPKPLNHNNIYSFPKKQKVQRLWLGVWGIGKDGGRTDDTLQRLRSKGGGRTDDTLQRLRNKNGGQTDGTLQGFLP